MANQSLVEIHAEDESSVDDIEMESSELCFDVHLTSGRIKVTTDQEGTYRSSKRLGTPKELIRNSVGDFVGDKYIITEDIEEKLTELKYELTKCWDEDAQMFTLEPVYDADGDIVELVIPIDCDITEPLTVKKLYNDDGEFVADKFKEKIDFNIYKIGYKDLYVKSVNKYATIYYEKKVNPVQKYNEKVGIDDQTLYNDLAVGFTMSIFGLLSIIGLHYNTILFQPVSNFLMAAMGACTVVFLSYLVHCIWEFSKCKWNQYTYSKINE